MTKFKHKNKRKANKLQLSAYGNMPSGRTVSEIWHNIQGTSDKTRQQKRRKLCIGLTVNTFKKRYSADTSGFRNENKRYAAQCSL